jgi:hypothetical protein
VVPLLEQSLERPGAGQEEQVISISAARSNTANNII